MNKAKMSLHSRAAEGAAEVVRRVIDGMDDTPFMQERDSDGTEARHRAVEESPDAMEVMERGLTRSYAERVARVGR